jgi:hypothetical protein
LNEAVGGSYVEESPRSLMNSNPDFFKPFTLVIATQVVCGPEPGCVAAGMFRMQTSLTGSYPLSGRRNSNV